MDLLLNPKSFDPDGEQESETRSHENTLNTSKLEEK